MSRLVAALLALALPLACPAVARADDTPPPGPGEHQGIGVYISNIAGSGLTYAREMPNGWGFHVSAIGWGQQGGTMFVNAGAALTREVDRRWWGRLYGLGAVGAGVGSFFGGGGLQPGADVQFNVTPGIGWTWGPFMAEFGYSLYYNASGYGFGPAGGLGLNWWF